MARDLVTVGVAMGSYQQELCVSLVFCVSTHVLWCEVKQQRVEIKMSGEDVVCPG